MKKPISLILAFCVFFTASIPAHAQAIYRKEKDPKVGTLQNGKWCESDGVKINCTQDEPTSTETDPVFSASSAYSINPTNISNWNTAFGWGNHASAGYVPTSRTVTINGTSQDLSSNRSWDVGTVTGSGLAGTLPYWSTSSAVSYVLKSFFNSVSNILDLWLTEGSELVSVGDFASSSGWTTPSGWSITGGKAQHASNGTGALTRSVTITKGYRYRLTYDVLDVTAGSVTFSCGGNTFTSRSSNDSYTEYFIATSSATIVITPTNTARLSVDNISIKQLTGSEIRIGSLYSNALTVGASTSNNSPGTTRHISLQNSGSYTYIDAYFGNNLNGAIGWNSSGIANYYASGSNHYFYGGTLTSPSLHNYLNSSGMFSYGVVAGSAGVSAGNTSSSQPSMFTSWGRVGFKHRYIDSATTLDNTGTYIDANGDAGSTCGSTPTYACSHWTTYEDCILRNSHGGCGWAAITCSSYDYEYGMGTCLSYSPSCTPSESNCSDSGWYDQTSCEAADDSYGGSCAYTETPTDCSVYNPTDQWTCEGNGCSYYDNSCSSYNYDQGSCESNSCFYDSMSGNCVGVCSGTNYSYSCDGTYYTGSCGGSGGSCSGTSSCAQISVADCTSESGCSISTGLPLTLPSHSSFSTNFWASYWIRNIGATYPVYIYPNTDQTVNKTTSLTISAGNWVHLSFAYHSQSCSTWDNTSESTCETGHTGCAYTACSGLSEEDCGNAGGQCTYSEGSCAGGGNCSGTWTIIRDWSIYGKS